MNHSHLSIALIARDKFSYAIESLSSLINSANDQTLIYVFDSGYPDILREELQRISAIATPKITIIDIPKYASTNVVWNYFVSNTEKSNILMCVENDVILSVDCIKNITNYLDHTDIDIAVPIVHEKIFSNPHFNPTTSKIIEKENGKIISILDRGRDSHYIVDGGRKIDHLERYCFAMSYDTAKNKLGELDEGMWDRTDYDMSMLCFKKGISIGIPPKGYVIFKPEPNLMIDRDFFDYRWNVDKVQKANERLIKKWNLDGFKKTVNHVFSMRKILDKEQTIHIHK